MHLATLLFAAAFLLLVAEASPTSYTSCGLSSSIHFQNWRKNVDSNAPVLFPTNEGELASILSAAALGGCKVRVRGAGHSFNGLVMQRTEEDVVVVHLEEFVNRAGWTDFINTASGIATIGAGRSILDLMSMTRPEGWLMGSHTFATYFTIGGVMSNSVAGASSGKGFLYDMVTEALVMFPNGTVGEVSGPMLPKYLGHYGLTGIVLAYRLQMSKDMGLSMQYVDFSYDLALPSSFGQMAIDSNLLSLSTHSYHCFMNPWPKPSTTIYDVSCLTTNMTGTPFTAAFKPAFQAIYGALKFLYPDLAYNGSVPIVFDICAFLLPPQCSSNVVRSVASAQATISELKQSWDIRGNISTGPVDGFGAEQANLVDTLSMFIPAPQLPAAIGAYLQVMAPFQMNGDNATYLPNAPLEWREVVPTGSSAFEYLQAGQKYYQLDAINLVGISTHSDSAAKAAFMLVEQQWINLGGVPHMGKGWGYSSSLNWSFGPHEFENEVFPLYPSSKLAAIRDLVNDNLFAAGSALLNMLPDNFTSYEPRELDDRACPLGNLQCLSEFCTNNICEPKPIK